MIFEVCAALGLAPIEDLAAGRRLNNALTGGVEEALFLVADPAGDLGQSALGLAVVVVERAQ